MHRPLKRFGQNFLNNEYYQKQIIQALEITEQDTIIEIGPGRGALVPHVIAKSPESYKAIEIDPRMVAELNPTFPEKYELINQDFLNINLNEIVSAKRERTKVIGNIPYNITSPILFNLLDNYHLFERCVLMVQKEVAKRISADAGNKDYGILSVISQTFSDVRYLFEVKRGNFFPTPQVDSAVIALHFRESLPGLENPDLHRKIVRGCFNYRRKMLRNSLGRIIDKTIVYSLESINLDQRPETLSINDFIQLSNEINQKHRQVNDSS